jgi:alpha-galactosidase
MNHLAIHRLRQLVFPAMAVAFPCVPELAAQEDSPGFEVAGLQVTAQGDPGPFRLALDSRSIEPGVAVARVVLQADSAGVPPPIVLHWSLPAHDVQGIWTTAGWGNKTIGPDWSMSGVASMFARNAPVLSLFGSDDGNRITIAASDALNPVRLLAGIREEDATLRGRIELFQEPLPATARAEIEIRFDRRPVPLPQSLTEGALPSPASAAPAVSCWSRPCCSTSA